MTQAMISAPPKRPKRTLTDAERRLRKADPTMATRMDEFALEMDATLDRFQATLDRDYDLAVNNDDDEGVPPRAAILDVETELAYELGRFSLAIEPMMEIADGVKSARDEAYMVLGDVEQRIAERTVQFMHALTPQAALPPPPPSDDDDDDPGDTEPLRVIRGQANVKAWRQDLDDAGDAPTVPLATKVERWWTRVRGWGRQLRAATTLLLAGVVT
jgi:hypothetical protein